MLQLLLALLGVAAAFAQNPYEVIVTYDSPNVNLLVQSQDVNVISVLFHYGKRGEAKTGRGVRTVSGWEYNGVITAVNGDNAYAYADIHYKNGLLVTTPHATFRLASKREVAPALSRQVRAVIFRDDFNSYNKGNWHAEVSMFGGFNWEFQVYTPETKNIHATGGHLFLRPTLTTDDARWDENFLHNGHMDMNQIWGSCTQSGNYGCTREGKNGMLPPVMSGKVSSGPTIRFGTVEVRAKIPRGDWLWPAIWMMPKSSVYGAWPRSGEIDIMESRGNAGDLGVGAVSSTLHWGPDAGNNRYSLTHGEKHASNYHTDFHTWRLDWTQDHLKTFIDNQQIMDVEVGSGFWAKGGFSGGNIWAGHGKSAPFDQDFFLMFNVAVGGTNGFFPDNANWGTRKPWANNSPHAAQDFWNGRNDWLPSWQGDNTALQVDYVEFRN
jgi:hypothetical protein